MDEALLVLHGGELPPHLQRLLGARRAVQSAKTRAGPKEAREVAKAPKDVQPAAQDARYRHAIVFVYDIVNVCSSYYYYYYYMSSCGLCLITNYIFIVRACWLIGVRCNIPNRRA